MHSHHHFGILENVGGCTSRSAKGVQHPMLSENQKIVVENCILLRQYTSVFKGEGLANLVKEVMPLQPDWRMLYVRASPKGTHSVLPGTHKRPLSAA